MMSEMMASNEHEMNPGPFSSGLPRGQNGVNPSSTIYKPPPNPPIVSILTLSIEMATPPLKEGIYVIVNKKSKTAFDLSGQDKKSIIGFTKHGRENQQVRELNRLLDSSPP